MGVQWGIIGLSFTAFGAFMLSSPERRERAAKGGAEFHRRLYGDVPGLDFFADIGVWRNLIWAIGGILVVGGLLMAADSFFRLGWFT